MRQHLPRVFTPSLLALAFAACNLFLPACQLGGKTPDEPTVVRPDAPPSYAIAAAKYNEQVADLSRVFVSGAVVAIKFVDDQQQEHREQVEGTLQLVRPDRLALNIRKIGQPLFWLGCDSTRYWWFDLTAKPTYAAIGRHDLFRPALARRIGLSIQPLDLIQLLGVMPLPIDDTTLGGTQWSRSGRLLGISTTRDGSTLRIWVDPETYLTQSIELFGQQGQRVLLATHSEHSGVNLRDKGLMPMLASRIIVEHEASGSVLDMTLPGATDGYKRISENAFVFERVGDSLKPERVLDLDQVREPSDPSPARPTSSPRQ